MALLTYTLMRLGLVLGAGAVLYVLGVRSWLLVVLAVLMGAGLSYVLLDPQRQAAARTLERRMGGQPTRVERSVERYAEEEDAELDMVESETTTQEDSSDADRDDADETDKPRGEGHTASG
ncbi:MAG TPA: DUF4229 domain-containing protein [Beutenbergiaceae bacterium]|nr:DUF4229 domain-containing protein [Beutenbergiaceae bacterium]